MANVIVSLAPTTELEAVNTALAAIGEAQLPDNTDLSTAELGADAQLAVNILRRATRETLTHPWKFNKEYGVELSPAGTLVWTDTSGESTTLNIFQLPAGVLAWEQTECLQNGDLDLVNRQSKQYQMNGVSAPVLYDRTRNRDGAEAAKYPHVYINVSWAVNFVDLPETARRYLACRTARQLCEQGVGSQQLAQSAMRDELVALKNFNREQGIRRRLNILDNSSSRELLGQRPFYPGRAWLKVFPGHN